MNLGKENETQEFKEGLGQLDRGLKSLTAMLNRHGYGSVYFGVSDNGDVKGLQTGKDTLLDIRKKVREQISPQILADIQEHTSDEGLTYISIFARGSNMPYSCDGRYYVRNVAADEKVSNEMLRKMLISGNTDLITKIPSENQELTFKQFLVYLGSSNIHISNEKALFRNYAMFTSEKQYNLMAYLLSDQNRFSMKMVRFNGIDKTPISERTEFGNCCLLESMSKILNYIESINTTKVDLSSGIRKETKLFHFESFREAWINACLHNSWSEGIPPSVFIYDDRIEVVSYGGLPYGLTREGFYTGNSLPVNKALLTVFIITGFAEQSGHGVPIIVSEYGRDAFSFENNMLKVSIHFSYEPDQVMGRKEHERKMLALTENQKKIINFVRDNPSATQKDIANWTGLSLSGIKKNMSFLQEIGFLERSGSKRNGMWIIK